MKKFVFLFTTTLISTTLFGQDATPQQQAPPTEFTVNKEQELTDFLVISCEGKTKEELYKKTMEWISKTYNNPSEVVKAQVENDYIRFQGISKKEYCFKNMITVCEDIKYQIEISFKEGKYKFDVLELQSGSKDKYGLTSWNDIKFKKSWMYFKGNGEIRDMYKDTMPKIANYFNALQKSLNDYIYNKNETARNNEW